MSENQNPAGDVQDPSEPNRVDVAVEVDAQPEPSDAGNDSNDEAPAETVTETHEVHETVTETNNEN